jgi:cold shock CspA family protein
MQRMRGEITTWGDRSCRWGFAKTSDGVECFVHQSAFRDHRHVPTIRVGTKIEFELLAVPSDQQTFMDKLNAGDYRDDSTIARNHRNPRNPHCCTVVGEKKPRASNIAVIEEVR